MTLGVAMERRGATRPARWGSGRLLCSWSYHLGAHASGEGHMAHIAETRPNCCSIQKNNQTSNERVTASACISNMIRLVAA